MPLPHSGHKAVRGGHNSASSDGKARTHAAYHSGDDIRSSRSPGRRLDVGKVGFEVRVEGNT